MIFDTFAAMVREQTGKADADITAHDVFTILIDLKDRGYINFDYELVVDSQGRKFVCVSHQIKHLVREICSRLLGPTKLNEDMTQEVLDRLTYYRNYGTIPLETNETPV